LVPTKTQAPIIDGPRLFIANQAGLLPELSTNARVCGGRVEYRSQGQTGGSYERGGVVRNGEEASCRRPIATGENKRFMAIEAGGAGRHRPYGRGRVAATGAVGPIPRRVAIANPLTNERSIRRPGN